MAPKFFNRFRKDPEPRPPVPVAELRGRFAAMDRDDLYALRRRWTARYLAIWHAVYDEVADAAGWDEKKRAKHRKAMDGALSVTDLWWGGGKRVEARRNEIESAVSALTHFAPQVCPDAPWVPQARAAAMQMRRLFQFVYDPASDFCVAQSAQAVYEWGELETWWPADTATMYGAIPADLRQRAGDEALVLVYTVGADAAGLRREGRAVIGAIHEIVTRLDEDPGPFPVDGILQKGSGDALRQRQRAQGYASFHGREPPGFVR